MRIRWRNECLLDAQQDNEFMKGIERGVKAFCEFDDTQISPTNEKRELSIYNLHRQLPRKVCEVMPTVTFTSHASHECLVRRIEGLEPKRTLGRRARYVFVATYSFLFFLSHLTDDNFQTNSS